MNIHCGNEHGETVPCHIARACLYGLQHRRSGVSAVRLIVNPAHQKIWPFCHVMIQAEGDTCVIAVCAHNDESFQDRHPTAKEIDMTSFTNSCWDYEFCDGKNSYLWPIRGLDQAIFNIDVVIDSVDIIGHFHSVMVQDELVIRCDLLDESGLLCQCRRRDDNVTKDDHQSIETSNAPYAGSGTAGEEVKKEPEQTGAYAQNKAGLFSSGKEINNENTSNKKTKGEKRGCCICAPEFPIDEYYYEIPFACDGLNPSTDVAWKVTHPSNLWYPIHGNLNESPDWLRDHELVADLGLLAAFVNTTENYSFQGPAPPRMILPPRPGFRLVNESRMNESSSGTPRGFYYDGSFDENPGADDLPSYRAEDSRAPSEYRRRGLNQRQFSSQTPPISRRRKLSCNHDYAGSSRGNELFLARAHDNARQIQPERSSRQSNEGGCREDEPDTGPGTEAGPNRREVENSGKDGKGRHS